MKPEEIAVLYTVVNETYLAVPKEHRRSNPFYEVLGIVRANLAGKLDGETKQKALSALELAYEESSMPLLEDISYERERIILGEIRDNFKKKVGEKTVYQMHMFIKEHRGTVVPIPMINRIRKEVKG